ncbi:LysM domain-containing protein [Pseudidiomarina sp.]|uniref:LysM peptidoglycan-binding domain-containing protein n=1 Tax=Pseudidiomarina sp. TaxID=2081707 RepID=UPI00299EFBAC|nr:LysM domain-containing protein [Pseudidiomarina sp.]MDX1706462.1 LysM domain-containing protein [Pseudidiomarina sp.]
MIRWRFLPIALIGFLLNAPGIADANGDSGADSAATTRGDVIRLREGAPQEYIVKKGDTLWDISELFLNDPWLWPELWRVNEDIDNPHLIYPGDRLYLVWRDGRPQLVRKQQKTLLPDGEVLPKGEAIPMFSREQLSAYLTEHRVMSVEAFERAPQILGDNRGAPRVNGMAPVFVEGDLQPGPYRVFTPFTSLQGEQLVRYVANARVTMQQGDLWEAELANLQREVRRGDVLLSAEQVKLPEFIKPQSGAEVDGYIVAALNERLEQGKFDVVVLDRGAVDGVEIGQMYQAVRPGVIIFTGGEKPAAVNRYKPSDDLSRFWRETTQLPAKVTAELLVIEVNDHSSYAMVVGSEEWLKVGDYYVPKYID